MVIDQVVDNLLRRPLIREEVLRRLAGPTSTYLPRDLPKFLTVSIGSSTNFLNPPKNVAKQKNDALEDVARDLTERLKSRAPIRRRAAEESDSRRSSTPGLPRFE